jgi:hypothetical protein
MSVSRTRFACPQAFARARLHVWPHSIGFPGPPWSWTSVSRGSTQPTRSGGASILRNRAWWIDVDKWITSPATRRSEGPAGPGGVPRHSDSGDHSLRLATREWLRASRESRLSSDGAVFSHYMGANPTFRDDAYPNNHGPEEVNLPRLCAWLRGARSGRLPRLKDLERPTIRAWIDDMAAPGPGRRRP